MAKLTSILLVIAFVSLVQGDVIKKSAAHIKQDLKKLHDAIHEEFDKHHAKHHPEEKPWTPEVCPKDPKDKRDHHLKKKPAIFHFNVDDKVTEIYVNKKLIPFQFSKADAKEWDKTKTMKMILDRGDVITVKGIDIGGLSGLVGSIHFFNKKGKEKLFSTGEGWYCNGKKAYLKGENNGKVKGWPYMPLIEKTAQWIWVKENKINKEVTCFFQIPCKKVK